MRSISMVVALIFRLYPIRMVDTILLTLHNPLGTLVPHHLTAHGYWLYQGQGKAQAIELDDAKRLSPKVPQQ